MKKLLFPLILTVTGNTFTAPKPQKTKSTRNSIASRILESEKKRLRKQFKKKQNLLQIML
ncbi:hypothetical protein AB8B23_11545 [Leptotrichia sp. HSP-342]|uniref:Uncharacterized protein n=1 Tax=Leptotrichia mesophila TaxID=3239303 RepID=A0AB39VBC5_9FUSO